MAASEKLEYSFWNRMSHPVLIKRLRAGLKSDETGNKANSLIFLHSYGFNIPLTYLVTTRAHEMYLREGQLVLDLLRKEVLKLPDKSYAIRSSTTAEDSREYSFAGQFQTFIHIRGAENILKAIKEVWNSASVLNDNEYLRKAGISALKCAVIIQEMISSKLAGVSFSRNPVTNQNEIVIEAVEGFGEELVQKGVSPFRWRIYKDIIIEGNSDYPNISVIRQVAKDTAMLKRYYGYNTDIEWTFDGNKVYYLQLRQITGRKDLNIYSSKMAREMLPGQIKPLVWSVNIPLVNGTWIKLLSEITGPLNVQPEDLAKSFYFRTYFNIAALSNIFREFGMSADSLEYLLTSDDSIKPQFKPGLRTLRHIFRIIRFVWSKLRFENEFLREYNILRKEYDVIADRVKSEFSLQSYNILFELLFMHGKRLTYLNIVAPLLMQFYNKKLSNKLKKLNLNYDHLDFHPDFPELRELSPLPVMQEIKEKINMLPEKIKNKCTSFAALAEIAESKVISEDIVTFMKDFGHLSESGNDFSVPSWNENPELLFNMIMNSATVESKGERFTINDLPSKSVKITTKLRNTYKKAGRFKVYREQISSLFTFGYGLFRSLFLQLGYELACYGVIEAPDDIFYLKRDEIEIILQGIIVTDFSDYREEIRKRKKEMNETKELILPSVIFGEEAPILEPDKTKNLTGTGSSPGAFKGITRVIKGLDDFMSVNTGDVLLIPFSDVSWTPILAKAGAIVSETGGILSHCSIIARELGIPAIVSVDNACSLGNGLNVTVNGSNGILTIHDNE